MTELSEYVAETNDIVSHVPAEHVPTAVAVAPQEREVQGVHFAIVEAQVGRGLNPMGMTMA